MNQFFPVADAVHRQPHNNDRCGDTLLAINLSLHLQPFHPRYCFGYLQKCFTLDQKEERGKPCKPGRFVCRNSGGAWQILRVVVAFNRRDYFRERFEEVNNENYNKSMQARYRQYHTDTGLYLRSNIGQLIVLSLGIWLIIRGIFQ